MPKIAPNLKLRKGCSKIAFNLKIGQFLKQIDNRIIKTKVGFNKLSIYQWRPENN